MYRQQATMLGILESALSRVRAVTMAKKQADDEAIAAANSAGIKFADEGAKADYLRQGLG